MAGLVAAAADDGVVALVERAAGDGPFYPGEPGDQHGEAPSGPKAGTAQAQVDPVGIRTAINAKIIGPTLSDPFRTDPFTSVNLTGTA